MKALCINLIVGAAFGFLLFASLGGFEEAIELWIR